MRRNLLTLLLFICAVCAYANTSVNAPHITVQPGSFPAWTQWPAFEDAASPAVKGYSAWDKLNLYLVLDIAQKEPVYAGEGRGIAFFNDGVELRISRGKTDGLLQIHGDAAGIMWVAEKLKPVSAGEIRLTTQCEKDKGYRLCFTLPWARLAPQTKAPGSITIRIFPKRVTRPLKFDIKPFSVQFIIHSKQEAEAPSASAAIMLQPAERVMNFGRPGFNSAELLEMLPVVLDTKPELVVVMIGTNNVAWPKKFLTPEQSADNIRKICDTVGASGAKMILCTIPPCIESMVGQREKMDAETTAALNAKIQAINAHIRTIAAERKIPLADFHSLFSGNLEAADSLIRNMVNSGSKDGVHPTPAGYVKMAKMVHDVIIRHQLPTGYVACAGDSITYGAHMTGQGSVRGDTYPAILNNLLMGKSEK